MQLAALRRQVAPPAFADYWASMNAKIAPPTFTGYCNIQSFAECHKNIQDTLAQPGMTLSHAATATTK